MNKGNKMSPASCPCCGQALVGDMPADALKDAPVGPTARLIVDELARIYPRGLDGRTLADRVYRNRPSGGPDSAENVVSVTIHRVKPVLRRYGWTVGAFGEAGNIRLQRVEA